MGGTSATERAQDTYTVRCPYLPDNYEGTGETMGKALEQLMIHIRDRHTDNVPEPVRSEVKTKLTACSHTLGTLPV